MKVTDDSTGETNRLINLMPSPHRERALHACDTQQAMEKKAALARAAKTTEREALVHTAILAKQARLENEPRHKWTSFLMIHYFDVRGIAIDEETVRKYVKEFPGF